jgi:hypothetical protein
MSVTVIVTTAMRSSGKERSNAKVKKSFVRPVVPRGLSQMNRKRRLSVSRSEIKTGWWKVSFDLKLEGEDVRFDDLSEVTQEHILGAIRGGCSQGEIIEEAEEENDEGTGYGKPLSSLCE